MFIELALQIGKTQKQEEVKYHLAGIPLENTEKMEKCDSISSISFGTENTQYNVVPSLRE
jgi:hypothetical protein